MTTKVCKKCLRELDVSEFSPSVSHRDRLQKLCKCCYNEKQMEKRHGKDDSDMIDFEQTKKVIQSCTKSFRGSMADTTPTVILNITFESIPSKSMFTNELKDVVKVIDNDTRTYSNITLQSIDIGEGYVVYRIGIHIKHPPKQFRLENKKIWLYN